MNEQALPRQMSETLANRLAVMPAVVVTGARQTGKSTLAQDLLPGERQYVTLDDLDVRDLAQEDPEALVAGEQPITLDEVQREPKLLVAAKRAIDANRAAGRFLITGSANLLLMRNVSETLAGRASYLTLWPMTRREQLGRGTCGVWTDLLASPPSDWLDILQAQDEPPADWITLSRKGGFPTPALQLRSEEERKIWFDGYVQTYLERDLQNLSAVSALPDFRRLMKAACLRLGQLVNQTELGRDVALSQPTVHRYLNLLEASYVLVRIPAYAVNRTKRLIKSPKLYWSDPGLALHIAGLEIPTGAHLENLVLQDLLVWRDSRVDRAEILYWRTVNGEEVDFVVEAQAGLLPIEVKASSRPRIKDAIHLRSFQSEYGKKALPGLLLHTGTQLDWLTPDVLACPWWRVF